MTSSEMPKSRSKGTRKFVGFPESILKSRFEQFDQRVSDVPPEIRSIKGRSSRAVGGQGTRAVYRRRVLQGRVSCRIILAPRVAGTRNPTRDRYRGYPQARIQTGNCMVRWNSTPPFRSFSSRDLGSRAKPGGRALRRTNNIFQPLWPFPAQTVHGRRFSSSRISIDRISFVALRWILGSCKFKNRHFS